MADKYRTERVLGPRQTTEFPTQHDLPQQQRRGYDAYAPPHPPASARHSVHDVALVLGLSAGALTPEVLAAVEPILAEMDLLRGQVEQLRRQQAFLERAADRHAVAPCLNRRAFVREVESFMQGGGTEAALAVVHAGGIERLSQLHGLAAGEGALRHACAGILAALRSSDVVGCLGGGAFGILFTAAAPSAAAGKLAEICRRINEQPFTWLGQPVPLSLQTGLHAPQPGEGAEQALAAADRARRGLE